MSIRITRENFPHGVVCGCDCNCARPLNDGNAMSETLQEPEREWDGREISPRIDLLLCAECYVGNHAAPRSPEAKR